MRQGRPVEIGRRDVATVSALTVPSARRLRVRLFFLGNRTLPCRPRRRVRARFETQSSLGAARSHGAIAMRRAESEGESRWRRDRASTRVRDCASDYLRALAAWIGGGGPLPTAERFLGPPNDASAAIRSDIAAAISGIEADLRQLQSLSTLSFALEQVGGNLESITGHFADRVSRLEDNGTAPALLISHPRQTI
ncbi:protein of unknown function (plasmid) [Caballeronia sp. S22]